MEISFIHMSMNQNVRVNKTNFHMKGFALGLALKQKRNATRKSCIADCCVSLATVRHVFCLLVRFKSSLSLQQQKLWNFLERAHAIQNKSNYNNYKEENDLVQKTGATRTRTCLLAA